MWKTLLTIFFPQYCVQCKKIGSYICANCFSYIQLDPTPICAMCNKKSIDGSTHPKCQQAYSIDGVISAVTYHRVIKRLLYKYKYRPYVSDLTNEIGKLMCESLEQNELFYSLLTKNVLFIPIPLYSKKLQKRGYNHAWLLCSYVAQYFNQKNYDHVIHRNRNTKPQYQLSKLERSSNVKNAFFVEKKDIPKIKGTIVVVIDDLATTCSTLREISKVLKRHGAKEVWGVVFARENLL